MASIIERIDLGCANNLMRVLISLTAPRSLIPTEPRRNQYAWKSQSLFKRLKIPRKRLVRNVRLALGIAKTSSGRSVANF